MHASTFALFVLLIGFLWSFVGRRSGRKLPPGPRGLPIIGNLHRLGKLPHRKLHELAKYYGPIMFMWLGYEPTIVVSSPQAAEVFLKTRTPIFADRPQLQVTKHFSYGSKGMAFTPYGPHWRNVKKFCIVELLSASKVASLAGMRKQELVLFVESLKKAAMEHQMVNMSERIAWLIEGMTYRLLFGCSKGCRFDLRTAIQQAQELAGAFNLADFVPLFRKFDLQGLIQHTITTSKKLDNIFEAIIEEHEKKSREHQWLEKDFVDKLLSLRIKPATTHDELAHEIDQETIKAVLFDMAAGAIDPSHSMITWTLSELIRHPRVMEKLQNEVKSVVGADQMVGEEHLSKLEYLEMVIKETFRLHPPAPLVLHQSMEETLIEGYNIPKNSRILVNVWALGRDPDVWLNDHVEDFLPERFRGKNIDFRGKDFQLIPFGAGRRICPGLHLALSSLRLVIAQLVHCFDWELPNKMSPMDMDMTEKYGLTAARAAPLLAKPMFRLQNFF